MARYSKINCICVLDFYYEYVFRIHYAILKDKNLEAAMEKLRYGYR